MLENRVFGQAEGGVLLQKAKGKGILEGSIE